MSRHTDAEYIAADPFFGEEGELTCRAVAIKTARKTHRCFTLDGNQDHDIQPGERYRHEKARVDGSFWGEYRICLRCMDEHLATGEDDDE